MDSIIASFIETRISFDPKGVVAVRTIGTAYTAFNKCDSKGRNKLYTKLRTMRAVRRKGSDFVGIKLVEEGKPKVDPMDQLMESMWCMGLEDVEMSSQTTEATETSSETSSDASDPEEIRKLYKAKIKAQRAEHDAELKRLADEYRSLIKQIKD